MNAGVTLERDGESVLIKIPMMLKRRMGRKEIIVPEGLEDSAPLPSMPQEPMITALARAFCWQELIDSGRYASIAALAEVLNVDRSYVRRIIGLACLAPDIVEAIAMGREPSGLSLERLAQGFPLAWDEQRERLAG